MSVDFAEEEKINGYEFLSAVEQQPIDILSQVEIIGIREGGLIDCWVPTELIDHEEVPVKEHWVESLAVDMNKIAEKDGGSGQLVPILLGKIEGLDKLKIIDGFHRDAALVKNGETRILSTIKETDLDELYDIRIFTAKDHVHVRFSRVVQWIREVWSISGLEDKLSVEQAVLLYRFNSSGSNLGLSEQEVTDAKDWIAKKENQWQMAAMTIHSHLKVAENVDPLLVHATREKKSGNVLEAPTQAIIKIFSKSIPGNFAMQNYVMDIAKAHNLKGPQVKALCNTVKDFTTSQQADAIVQYIDWQTWKPEFGETKTRSLRRAYDPRYKGAAVLDLVSGQIQNISERVEQSLRQGEQINPEMINLVWEAERRIAEVKKGLGLLGVKLSQLRNPVEPTTVEDPSNVLDLVEKSPEDIATENRKKHEAWGLKFALYDDEAAPTVYFNGKARYEMNDTMCVILQCAAERKSCETLSADQIAVMMTAKGYIFPDADHGKVVRAGVREISSFLKKYGKDRHAIIRTGGQKQVSFGLSVE